MPLPAAAHAASHSPEAGSVEYTGPTFDFSQENPQFRIGFLPAESAADVYARNACLSHYAEKALGVPAPMYYFAEYSGLMESALGGNLDYAWFGASSYAGVYLDNPDAMVPVLTRMQADWRHGLLFDHDFAQRLWHQTASRTQLASVSASRRQTRPLAT